MKSIEFDLAQYAETKFKIIQNERGSFHLVIQTYNEDKMTCYAEPKYLRAALLEAIEFIDTNEIKPRKKPVRKKVNKKKATKKKVSK
jgi:hypothetical protein